MLIEITEGMDVEIDLCRFKVQAEALMSHWVTKLCREHSEPSEYEGYLVESFLGFVDNLIAEEIENASNKVSV